MNGAGYDIFGGVELDFSRTRRGRWISRGVDEQPSTEKCGYGRTWEQKWRMKFGGMRMEIPVISRVNWEDWMTTMKCRITSVTLVLEQGMDIRAVAEGEFENIDTGISLAWVQGYPGDYVSPHDPLHAPWRIVRHGTRIIVPAWMTMELRMTAKRGG